MDIRLSDILNKDSITVVINENQQTREIILQSPEARKTLKYILASFFDVDKISKKDGIIDKKEQIAFFKKAQKYLIPCGDKKRILTRCAMLKLQNELFGKKMPKANEKPFDFSVFLDTKKCEKIRSITLTIDEKTGKKIKIAAPDEDAKMLLFASFVLFFDIDHNGKLSIKEQIYFYEKIKDYLLVKNNKNILSAANLMKMAMKYYADKIHIGSLIQNLSEERNDNERTAAAEMLRALGRYTKKNDEVRGALTTALKKCDDLDQQVGIMGILADIDKDGTAILHIMRAAQIHPEKAAKALSALGYKNPSKIIPFLIKGLTIAINMRAEKQDGMTPRKAAQENFEKQKNMVKALKDALVEIGAPAVKYLIAALKPSAVQTPETRRAICIILTSMVDHYTKNPDKLCGCGKNYKYEIEHISAEIIPHKKLIAQLLKHDNPKLRIAAADLLMRFELEKDIIPYIREAICDSEPEVLWRAAYIAGKMDIQNDKEILRLLLELLKNPDEKVKNEAAQALRSLSYNLNSDNAVYIAQTLTQVAVPKQEKCEEIRRNIFKVLDGIPRENLQYAVPYFVTILKCNQPAPNPSNGEYYIFFNGEEQGNAARLLIKTGPLAIHALMSEIHKAKKEGKLLPLQMSIKIAFIFGEAGKNDPSCVSKEMTDYLEQMLGWQSFRGAQKTAKEALLKIKSRNNAQN